MSQLDPFKGRFFIEELNIDKFKILFSKKELEIDI